jgi:transcriptional regulator with XRE-family HTH domain
LSDLARRCGVRRQRLAQYEAGAVEMTAVTLWRLAKALDVPMSHFFQGLPAKTPSAPPLQTEGEEARSWDLGSAAETRLRATLRARRPRALRAGGAL